MKEKKKNSKRKKTKVNNEKVNNVNEVSGENNEEAETKKSQPKVGKHEKKPSQKTEGKHSKEETKKSEGKHSKEETKKSEGKHSKDETKKTQPKTNANEKAEPRRRRRSDSERKSKDNVPVLKIIAITLSVIIVLSAIAITAGYFYFKDRWYVHSTVNGTDVSKMELSQSQKIFDDIYKDYKLTLKGRNDLSTTINMSDIDMTIEDNGNLKKTFDQQHDTFYIIAFFRPQKLISKPETKYSEEKLKTLLDGSDLIMGTKESPIIPPTDTCIKFSDKGGYFEVQPATDGNTLIREKFDPVVSESLKDVIQEVNLDDANTYPGIYKALETAHEPDENFQKRCDAYNGSTLHWMTWKMPNGSVISITPQDIMNWYDMSDDFKLTLNTQKVKDWVEKFCLKYKTSGITRTFKTHSGNEIQISGGDFGWQMDYDATCKQVLDVLNAADNSTKISTYLSDSSETNKAALTHNFEPVFKSKGNVFNPDNLTADYVPGTYSEVSISDQCVYVYKDGQCVYTAHCITGLPTAEKATTKGVWFVKEKLRHKTLRGPGYATPVSYWVRITWTGIGYHDATWQAWGSWSPTKYMSVGSHGCVNLSMTDVAKIYELVNVNDPVFIY